MTDYAIRKLAKDEFHLLIPLMVDCFGMHVDLDYFQWKFTDNPSGFVEGFIAVSPENEVAAYYGVIPELYLVNGKETVIYQSCDTMTHSSHRRKGLFQKLALYCYESLRAADKLFVIGFGGGQSTPGFLKFGWQPVFEMKYYFFPRQLVFGSKSVSGKVKEINDAKLIEHIVLQSNASGSVHAHKTLEIFQWRISNPKHDYKLVGFDSGNGFDSFLCYYVEDGKIILFDFHFGSHEAGKQLTAYLKNLMRTEKHKGILAFIQEKSLQAKTLGKLGFISNPFSKGPLSLKVPFIFYASETEMQALKAPEKWTIGSFDHDAL